MNAEVKATIRQRIIQLGEEVQRRCSLDFEDPAEIIAFFAAGIERLRAEYAREVENG